MSRATLDRLIGTQTAALDMFENMLEGLRERARETLTRDIANAQFTGLERMWTDVLTTHQDISSRKLMPTHPYLTDRIFWKIQKTRDEVLDIVTPILSQNSNSNASNTQIPTNDTNTTESLAKLPRIDLPRFSGKIEDWEEFADLFENAVHNRRNINDAARLQYLKSCVSDIAAEVIKDFKITNLNYKIAWNELRARFSNPRYLVRQEIEALFRLKLSSGDLGAALHSFISTAKRILRGLADRGLPVDSWDVWVVILLSSRVDANTRTLWEDEMSKRSQELVQSFIVQGESVPVMRYFPKFAEFVSFIERQCNTLRMTGTGGALERRRNFHGNSTSSARRVYHTGEAKKCPLCSGEHKLFKCEEFLRKRVTDRRSLIARLGLCFNCTGSHHSKVCRLTPGCRHCDQRHHSILHLEYAKSGKKRKLDVPALSDGASANKTVGDASQATAPATMSNSSSAAVHLATTMLIRPLTILATAIVILKTEDGITARARAILDQGSEVTFISKSMAQVLRLKIQAANLSLVGLGSHSVGTARGLAKFILRSIAEPEFSVQANAYVLPKLSSCLPSDKVCRVDISAMKGLLLADPTYHVPGGIDLILGANLYAQLLRPGLKTLPNQQIAAQRTVLGWILSGVARQTLSRRAVTDELAQAYHCLSNDCAFSTAERFWKLEDPAPPTSLLTPDEQLCENMYSESITRDQAGRYTVRLPVRQQLPCIAAETRRMSFGAMSHLHRRFERDPRPAVAYNDFMDEYEKLGHMEKVPEHEVTNSGAYYLPHHPVVSVANNKYKLRVVFDASRKTKDRHCLNDYLLPGPALQSDLHLILLNWRRYRVAFTADIIKMFRQIDVERSDRDLQRIVWSPAKGKPFKEYRLTTVTYGTACAPFLAIRTLRQLAQDEGQQFPRGAHCLLKETYVDDIFTGADDILHAREIQLELITLLRKAGIEFDKWAANYNELRLGTQSRETKHIDIEGPIKTLGVCWDAVEDRFAFRPIIDRKEKTWTKRSVLSHVAQLFDPLGWLAPILITARIFMQDLCIHHAGWDEPLHDDLRARWLDYRESLATLPELYIDRWLGTSGTQSLQLHGFSDASKRAYAAAVYLSIQGSTTGRAVLMSAKTKVAPLKTASIPNLELCGAALLTDLVKRLLRLDWLASIPVFLWTDSEIVLAWLDKHPSQWKTFVANRVSQIQTTLPAAAWSYVHTKENPADIATRGLNPRELSACNLWWYGPKWLTMSPEQWPTRQARVKVHHTRHVVTEPDFITRFSNFTRLVRFIGYCWRLRENCRRKKENRPLLSSFLSTEELNFARNDVIKIAQRAAFSDALHVLKIGKPLPRRSALTKLRPFLDNEGLLRVGGRLSLAEINYDLRHPPILSRASHLSRLLVVNAHHTALHGGPTTTTAVLWRQAWIIGSRRLIKTIIRNCIPCQRAKPRLAHQLMGSLPAERISITRPFSVTGLDYAGPFLIRTTKGRGYRSYKGYIALFVCFATRAIHLELVSDLTTGTFLAAYRRFASRRGICKELVSDNATTFKGADAELRALFEVNSTFYRTVGADLANLGTKWRFIPPNTPHYGGLWEAGVKSVKHHLRRTIAERTLTVEEFTTLLAEIEACLNSRPLCPLTSDPDDLHALTPAHFLHGGVPAVLPASDSSCQPDHCLSRYNQLQRLRNQLWRRWSDEYIQQLQERSKWRSPTENFKVGQLVILRDDRFPPTKWPLGRIVQTHAGRDGLVRVVTIKTTSSLLKRHIARVAPLLDQDTTSN